MTCRCTHDRRRSTGGAGHSPIELFAGGAHQHLSAMLAAPEKEIRALPVGADRCPRLGMLLPPLRLEGWIS